MSYTPTQWNTGDTITASALNKIEQGIAEGGGGGYDLVIASTTRVSTGAQNMNNWSIIKGSIEACEEKLELGLPINAIAVVWDSQWSADPPNDQRAYLPLSYFHGPYNFIRFGCVVSNKDPANTTSTPTIYSYTLDFRYHFSTRILEYGFYYKTPIS